jgi:hypothetical protein
MYRYVTPNLEDAIFSNISFTNIYVTDHVTN